MSIINALASVAVKNLQVSYAWYENLFGRGADSKPMLEVAEWKFNRGGWLQVYQSQDRTGVGSVTLVVDDIDEQKEVLKRLGIDPGHEMGDEKVRVIMIRDPDGNSIAFAQTSVNSIAQ